MAPRSPCQSDAMTDSAFIVLAAGSSRRMGPENKLLLTLDGQPLVRRAVEACLATTLGPVTVVLGHERDAVFHALVGLDIRTVDNVHFADGQMTSVAAGLAASPPDHHAVLVLGDQPRLSAQALRTIVDVHVDLSNGRITVPLSGDGSTRGNPIVIPPSLRARILGGDTKLGCRHLTRRYPELVAPFVTNDPAYFTDIDTPDDLARERRLYEGEAA